MDIEVYIRSGILEKYVFGTANELEIQTVEHLREIYPTINEALTDIEKALAYFADQNKIEPPEEWKEKIIKNLRSIK